MWSGSVFAESEQISFQNISIQTYSRHSSLLFYRFSFIKISYIYFYIITVQFYVYGKLRHAESRMRGLIQFPQIAVLLIDGRTQWDWI